MADKKIEEATRVASVDGSEILPASVSGAAKSLTTDQVKTYVVAAVAALADVSDFGTDANDRVMVKTNGENKHLAFSAFADDIFAALMGKTAATTLADADTLIIKNDSDEKTVTVGALKSYISTAFSGNMDIHGLTAADSSTGTDELAAYQAGDTNANRKVTVAQIAVPVCAAIPAQATQSTSAIADTDELIIASGTSLKKVALQNAGIKVTGTVTGPATTTQGKVPQWDATNGKLTVGLTLTTGVGSSSLDTEIPTAKAAYDAAKDKVSCISSATDGDLVRFDGNTGKAVKGGISLVTSVGDTGSDSAVPTEQAVREAIDSVGGDSVTTDDTPSAGAIAVFTTNGSKEVDATTLKKTTSVRATASASDTLLPTEKAVATAVATKIDKPSGVTDGHIPLFSGTTGAIADGKAVVTSVRATGTADNASIPTEAAVRAGIEQIGGVSVTMANAPASGTIPYFASSTRSATTKAVTTSVASTASSSNEKIPTEFAVSQAIESMSQTAVKTASVPAPGTIPYFATTSRDATTKNVVTTVDFNGSTNDQIPTANAVRVAIEGDRGKMRYEHNTPIGSDYDEGVIYYWYVSGKIVAATPEIDGVTGTITWHHIEFADVMHKSGTNSNNISQIEGATYYDTSSGKLYMWLGSGKRQVTLA